MQAGARCWIWAGSGPESKSVWPRFRPVLVYCIYLFSVAAMQPCFGLLVAQILQTGVDCPSAIILHSMWVGARCWNLARIKIRVAQIWASSASFGLFMADSGPSFGLLWPKFGKQERTAQVPSFFTVCGPEQGVGYMPEWKSMWHRFGPPLLHLVYSSLTLGLPLAYLWSKSGKQKWTTQVPLFHAVCGPDESGRYGPDLGLRNFQKNLEFCYPC